MAVAGPDAREHPRAKARIKVEYHFGSTTGSGHTSDISEGGMFLECDRAAEQGTRVYLRIHLPGSRAGDPLKIIGSVTRADDAPNEPVRRVGRVPRRGMGIHFEVAYSRTREALADFVRGLILHSAGIDSITALDGATDERPAFGVRLVKDEREKLLSAVELESAFAFDTGQRLRTEATDQASGLIFKAIVALLVLGFGAYLALYLAGVLG